jgi:hypothetical protein
LWLLFVVLYRSVAFFDEFWFVAACFVAVRLKILSKGSLCSINDAKTRRIENQNGSSRVSWRTPHRNGTALVIERQYSSF